MTLSTSARALEAAEARLHDLDRQRMEALHDRYRGRESADLTSLDAEESRLLSDPDYRSALEAEPDPADDRGARRLLLHRRRWHEAAVRTDERVARRARELQARLLEFRPWLVDRPAEWVDVKEALRHEPDRERREAAWFAAAPLAERIEAELSALVGLRNDLARSLGHDGFPAMAMAGTELSVVEYLALCDELEGLTRPAFEQMLDWARGQHGGETLEPWDLDYDLARLEPPAAAFPAAEFAGRFGRLIAAWGIDLARLPIRIEPADLPYGGLTLPVSIPDDIRVLVNPRDGVIHLETWFHEMGHALHLAHVRTDERAFHWESGAFDEAMAYLLEAEGLDQALAGLPESEAVTTWRQWRAVYRMRQLLASSLFEILASERPGGDLHSLYCEIQEHYLGFPRHPERLWSARALFITHPLYMPNYVIGRLVAAQLAESLAERFGRLDLPEVGALLRRELWGPGASVRWDDKLASITGRPLDPDAYLRRHGIAVPA